MIIRKPTASQKRHRRAFMNSITLGCGCYLLLGVTWEAVGLFGVVESLLMTIEACWPDKDL